MRGPYIIMSSLVIGRGIFVLNNQEYTLIGQNEAS